MTTNNVKLNTIGNEVSNSLKNLNCIVTNHAAPAAVQDDEQALEYAWREILCSGNWDFQFLVTTQGNIYALNPCSLHHCFDNGHITFKQLQDWDYVGECQEITVLPDTGKESVNVLNFCGVFPA